MSPLSSTITTTTPAETNVDMYQTLKGRQRRPSAKLLANFASPDPSPVSATKSSSSPAQSVSPTAPTAMPVVSPPPFVRPAMLMLQSAVAEVILEDEEAEHSNSADQVEARLEPVTVDSLPAGEWRTLGWTWYERRARALKRRQDSRSSRNRSSVRKVTAKSEDIAPPAAHQSAEEPSGESLESAEHNAKSEEILNLKISDEYHNPADEDSQSESSRHEDGTRTSMASPTGGEVKRKRGRPFKGQEKPIEERLMIETTKIRRLIDDIMRKGSVESEFCLRLRNIARDLDEVMAMGVPGLGSPMMEAVEEGPTGADDVMLPEAIAHPEIANNAAPEEQQSTETTAAAP